MGEAECGRKLGQVSTLMQHIPFLHQSPTNIFITGTRCHPPPSTMGKGGLGWTQSELGAIRPHMELGAEGWSPFWPLPPILWAALAAWDDRDLVRPKFPAPHTSSRG